MVFRVVEGPYGGCRLHDVHLYVQQGVFGTNFMVFICFHAYTEPKV